MEVLCTRHINMPRNHYTISSFIMAKGHSKVLCKTRIICHRSLPVQAKDIHMSPGPLLAAMGFRLSNSISMILASMGSLVMVNKPSSIAHTVFNRTVSEALSCSSFSAQWQSRVNSNSFNMERDLSMETC